ncbi:MAG: hypothetical protein CL677_07675 [Bdellovibrionaceae bacterium]|nr:hypothetical protein [Pseudobdellovibrionaceae bacterium]|tara:strand:+ start:246 stop:953 length:708 start_codon:yes stop_codon:yes gene_type:complete
MESEHCSKSEVFSYHLVELPLFAALKLFLFPPSPKKVPGLKFSKCLFTMNLGQDVFSVKRYNFKTLAFVARWSDEESFHQFLIHQKNSWGGWDAPYVLMKPYRRWGSFAGLDEAPLFEELKDPSGPVIGFTIANLRLSQTVRFAKWGKPVESQVRDHAGKRFAAVAMRPLRWFSTFSVWESEEAMLSMVQGSKAQKGGMNHREAMQERARKPFHHEFTTLRFVPIKDGGLLKLSN